MFRRFLDRLLSVSRLFFLLVLVLVLPLDLNRLRGSLHILIRILELVADFLVLFLAAIVFRLISGLFPSGTKLIFS